MPKTPLEDEIIAAQKSGKNFTVDRRTMAVGTDRKEDDGTENSPLKAGVMQLAGVRGDDIRVPMSYSYHRVLKGETESDYNADANRQWLLDIIKQPEVASRPTTCYVFHAKITKALSSSLMRGSDGNKVDIRLFMRNFKNLSPRGTGASYEEVMALLHSGYSVIKSFDRRTGVAILQSPEVLAAVSPTVSASTSPSAAAGGAVSAAAAAAGPP